MGLRRVGTMGRLDRSACDEESEQPVSEELCVLRTDLCYGGVKTDVERDLGDELS